MSILRNASRAYDVTLLILGPSDSHDAGLSDMTGVVEVTARANTPIVAIHRPRPVVGVWIAALS